MEIRPYPSGITRNIVQCLQDFSIPLHLSHAVTRICGRDRVEGVDVAPLQDGVPVDSGMFQQGAKQGPPPGTGYHTIEYGLFEPFSLLQVSRR